MKQAKSMYLGGEIVRAIDCDFSSSKNLGIVCPYCSEAVFLRSGGMRDQTLRNGQKKTQIVNPYFAHYAGGSYNAFECENRSMSAEGRERLRTIAIEARNQRLDLYNRRLWEMFKNDRNIREKRIAAVCRKHFKNPRELEVVSIAARRYWGKILPRVYEFMEMTIEKDRGLEWDEGLKGAIERSDWERQRDRNIDYYGEVGLKYHRAVCKEIADFLSTRTGGHAFYWLSRHAVYILSLGGADSFLKKLDDYHLCLTIASQIAIAHWIEQINLEIK